jgi:hypothetical protein
MNEYWVVIENKTGVVICQCGNINDAIMMVNLDPHNRTYSRQRFLEYPIINVSTTASKELPGQLGLPAAEEVLPQVKIENQLKISEGLGTPVVV